MGLPPSNKDWLFVTKFGTYFDLLLRNEIIIRGLEAIQYTKILKYFCNISLKPMLIPLQLYICKCVWVDFMYRIQYGKYSVNATNFGIFVSSAEIWSHSIGIDMNLIYSQTSLQFRLDSNCKSNIMFQKKFFILSKNLNMFWQNES